jgi:copper chaperone CopZ
MKKLMIVLMAALFMMGCNSISKNTEDSASENLSAEWVEVTLNVEGMTCTGCENAVKAGIESLEGISTVESSFAEGWTKVKYDKSTTTIAEIEGKITDTGYAVKGEL